MGTGPCAEKEPTFGLMLCSCLLKFLPVCKQGAPHFHSALGPPNPGPALHSELRHTLPPAVPKVSSLPAPGLRVSRARVSLFPALPLPVLTT